MNWPAKADRWSESQIAADVRAASDEFRRRRLSEPLARYLAAFDGAVKGLLIGMGRQLAKSRPSGGIRNLLNDSPPPRLFLTQTNLGADNADVLVRLDDGRLLAIECKGSNSEINSRKRLNKEAAQNARAWLQRFGSQVVPGVALQGVFNPRYVVEAQDTPMLVFWGHRLEDLRRFVDACR